MPACPFRHEHSTVHSAVDFMTMERERLEERPSVACVPDACQPGTRTLLCSALLQGAQLTIHASTLPLNLSPFNSSGLLCPGVGLATLLVEVSHTSRKSLTLWRKKLRSAKCPACPHTGLARTLGVWFPSVFMFCLGCLEL